MSSLSVCGDLIAASCGAKLVVCSEKGGEPLWLELPPARPPVKENKPSAKEKDKDKDAKADGLKNTTVGLRFSPSGKWLAAYSSTKQLLIWETKTWSLASDRDMPKAATSFKFTPDERSVVIVDKAGDAVRFSVQDLGKEGDIILGHLSMLLDVVLTPDGKHIITCDRDEKIRVSNFPNAYNIVSYCLGHKEFVSSICLLPHKTSILLSGSGDCTLRLWDYMSGASLETYDCSSDVKRELQPDPTCLSSAENEQLGSIIIKKVYCVKQDDSSSFACVLFNGFLGGLVYRTTGKGFELVQVIHPQQIVLDLCFESISGLIVRTVKTEESGSLHCLSFDKESNKFISSIKPKVVDKVSEILDSTEDPSTTPSNLPQLVKRKFDNVKDYYEQKKARIGER